MIPPVKRLPLLSKILTTRQCLHALPTGARIGRRSLATVAEAQAIPLPVELGLSPKRARRRNIIGREDQEVQVVAEKPKRTRKKKVEVAVELEAASKGTRRKKVADLVKPVDENAEIQATGTTLRGSRRKKGEEVAEAEAAIKTLKKTRKKKNAGESDNNLAPPPPSQLQPQQIKLRDYQQECISAVLDHVKQGHRRLGISLATGAGKTVIFTQLIDRLPPLNENATQTLILVHRRELLEQALRHCTLAYPDKVVEVEMANKHATGMADITVASIASIVSKDRLDKFNSENYKLILIDECHHAVSTTYMKTLDHFGALHPEKNGGSHPVVVGVSATMSRHDGLKMGTILDYVVYHKDYIDMIKDNWLTNVMFTTVQTHVDLSAVKQTRGDFNTADLSRAVNTNQTNDITVRSWMEKAGSRKSTLVFCVDISHVVEMANMFRKHGIDAQFVTSLTPKNERHQRLEEFRRAEYPVLVNCGILTEGTDIPNIDCVLLARPTRSKNLLIQMIGRGMRLSPGKKTCHVIDMIGALDQSIISTPTLFGLDPFAIVQEATPQKLQEMSEAAKEELAKRDHMVQGDWASESGSILDPVSEVDNGRWLPIAHLSFTDYESIFDLLRDKVHDKLIRQLSQYAWVKVGPSDFILSTQRTTLKIEKQEDGTYSVIHKSAPSYNPILSQFITPAQKVISKNLESLQQAVAGADTYATTKIPRNLILHSATWRKTQASEQQLTHLERMKPDGQWRDRKMTKGQAGDVLTRMKHGYIKFQQALKQARKQKETVEKKIEEKKSKEVRVGRLVV